MEVLRLAVAVLALSACYSPELRDCAVACASGDDCGPGQVCGADRWCAGPTMAGRCETTNGTGIDASVATDAAATITDAAVPVDAVSPALLVVQIGGHGIVTIPGTGTCADTAPTHQCTFAVIAGVPLTLDATGTGGDEFEQWMNACAGQGATCMLTPTIGTTTTQAKFKH